MTTIPLWAELAVSFLVVFGAALALTGSVGLLRLRSFYDRIHAPTLGSSWGTMATILASMIYFSVMDERVILHEILIGLFIMCTTPVTLMLLSRAALYREFAALLEQTTGMKPVLWDERRTTIEAHQILNEGNYHGKKRKNTVDAVAASLILEGYLAYLRNHKE